MMGKFNEAFSAGRQKAAAERAADDASVKKAQAAAKDAVERGKKWIDTVFSPRVEAVNKEIVADKIAIFLDTSRGNSEVPSVQFHVAGSANPGGTIEPGPGYAINVINGEKIQVYVGARKSIIGAVGSCGDSEVDKLLLEVIKEYGELQAIL